MNCNYCFKKCIYKSESLGKKYINYKHEYYWNMLSAYIANVPILTSMQITELL